MKKLLFLFFLFPTIVFGQDLQFEMTKVVEVEGASKADLYDRAIQFINASFKSSKDVIQSSDKASGTIYAKGMFCMSEFDAVYFSMNIAIKDGKYKYEITNLKHQGHGGGYGGIARVEKVGGAVADDKPDCKMPGKHWKKIKKFASSEMAILSASFEKAMKEKAFNDF